MGGYFLVVLFLLVPLNTQGRELQDNLMASYSDFFHQLESKNTKALEAYITPNTKVGFGPNQGFLGFRKEVLDNDVCLADMLWALKQGCKITGVNQEAKLNCVAPPQFVDETILYLGPRIEFTQFDNKQFEVNYVVCGGD